MSDYVTKDAVQRVITNSAAKLYMTGQISKEESPKLVAYILSAVEKMPGVDVVERKSGKWMPIYDGNELGEVYQSGVYCSECDEELQSEPNFCPNCGSSMRNEP